MKKILKPLLFTTVFFSLTGCNYSSDAWENTKTAARYLQRKGKSLFSDEIDSRLVYNEAEFYGPDNEEFIPLHDQDLQKPSIEFAAPQPKQDPGAKGSKIPGIDKFQTPSSQLASIFRNVYFNTDDHTLRAKEYYHIVQSIASHLKRHPKVYVFVAGHCDDRASESYNLALGARRANFVRNLLIKEGVNPNQIYTISYGKERPLVMGTTKAARIKNRRVEFKIFDQKHNR